MVIRPSSTKAIPNTFLRKKRKWPHSPYKTHWHFTFQQQQALQNLKQLSLQLSPNPSHQGLKTTLNPPKTLPPLLNGLIDSFAAYNCDPTPDAYQFVIKTLIGDSRFIELDQVLSYLQNVEKFETPERIFVYLIRVYGENGMDSEAIDLFFGIPSFRCVPTVDSLHSLLLVLCRKKEYLRFVPQLLLKSSRDLKIRVEESTYLILIRALCRIGRVGYAIKLLNYVIDDDGLNPDDKACSLILLSLCQLKGVTSDEVMGILEGMRMIGFCPTKVDFRNLIKFLVKQGKGKDAYDVLCEMKREGFKPEIACYTMVLHGLVEEGEFSRVEQLFDEILVFGLVPELRTYNAYVNGLCKQKKADSAFRMISCMQEMGCHPDLTTYKASLEAFCKVKELARAREVWREIKLRGIEIDVNTYRIMIDALLSGGEVINACNLLEEMLSNSSTSVSSALDDIICSFCCGGLASEVLRTLDKACSHGVVLGYRAWEALLQQLKLDLGCERVLLAKLVNCYEE